MGYKHELRVQRPKNNSTRLFRYWFALARDSDLDSRKYVLECGVPRRVRKIEHTSHGYNITRENAHIHYVYSN